ncbi:2-succinyl-5-enolpyruvyl-6-hydroxy-3-cyclohexene-1-carboxylic-acid synthase [Limibacter armeniacum]|uniref:2-succinyl-5-enolpyruvyl-6-hydroxy-3- cyclohexene-1-carboxylic-acid synthase n=1 Tax=Limibacter armeniacum TaxID=466084 RepID=UPI002FE593DA
MNEYKLQPLVNIASICAKKQVKHAVLSPGSRCAPLCMAMVRHPEIITKTISDERSAAFIAMGMAQQDKSPVVIVCTSGTAALNYGPAIAEAFYQNVPLIVLTADRPDEWVDQQDGQTIRQRNIFENHVKASYHLPASFEHPDAQWQYDRTISEAINTANAFPKGPVHINIPIREPFYPAVDETLNFDYPVKVIESFEATLDFTESQWNLLSDELVGYEKILIVAGQDSKNEELAASLAQLPFPVCADVISNYSFLPNAIRHQDVFLNKVDGELTPDLLITFGNSVISKNLKLYLRKHKPKAHWQIQPAGNAADTYQALSRIIRITPEVFFSKLAAMPSNDLRETSYLNKWKREDSNYDLGKAEFFTSQPFSELEAVSTLIDQLPESTNLHLANSMSVRYANFINIKDRPDVEVMANRGSSGIDGCTSSMIGHSLINDKPNILITGDLAFFYDRNAFWNNYVNKGNQKVLLLNNHGGVIFRMIDGPARQPELEEYFETFQHSNAEQLCKEFGIHYISAKTREEYEVAIKEFTSISDKPCILEVETEKQLNKEVFQAFKKI